MPDDVENQRITIVPTQSRPRREHTSDVTLMTRRTLSIRAPTVPPSARLPIEFRTLSLHLEHSKKSDHSGGKGSKRTVKGQLLSSPPCFDSNNKANPGYSRLVRTRLAPCVRRRGAPPFGGSAEDRAGGRASSTPRRAIRCQPDFAASETHTAQGHRLDFWWVW
jgi:hypothetical protein